MSYEMNWNSLELQVARAVYSVGFDRSVGRVRIALRFEIPLKSVRTKGVSSNIMGLLSDLSAHFLHHGVRKFSSQSVN
jgi:hypothetical protein